MFESSSWSMHQLDVLTTCIELWCNLITSWTIPINNEQTNKNLRVTRWINKLKKKKYSIPPYYWSLHVSTQVCSHFVLFFKMMLLWRLPSSVLCTVNRRKSGNACSYALQCCAVNCSGRGKRSAGRLTCSRRRSRSFRRKVECQYFFWFVSLLAQWLFVASQTRLEIRGEQAGISLCLALRASVSCIDFCTNNTTTVYQTYIKEPYYDHVSRIKTFILVGHS